MAAPGAHAMLVAFSTMTSVVLPAGQASTGHVEMALHLPRLSLQAPATVPAAASPRLQQDRHGPAGAEADVDITGPTN